MARTVLAATSLPPPPPAAAAHDTAHLHPHGAETGVGALLLAAAVTAWLGGRAR